MVMRPSLPPPGPTVGQQELSKSLIRMLKLYRSEKDLTARRQLAFSIASCALQLHEFSDNTPGAALLRWLTKNEPPRRCMMVVHNEAGYPCCVLPMGHDGDCTGKREPPPPPPPPEGRVVRDSVIPSAADAPERCLHNCKECGERCSWPAVPGLHKCDRHKASA